MAIANLIARFKADGAEETQRKIKGNREEMNRASEAARHMGGTVRGLGAALSSLKVQAGHIAAVSAGIAGIAGAVGFADAARLDSLTRGLASVSVSAEDLQGQLRRLKEVAKLPGLGFEEAVQGSVALQAAGLSAQLAERSLMAFGNALATVGKGKDDLNGVTLALQQMAAKGKISAEEINQINERVPQIRAAMQRAFGTADTEQLGKMGIDVKTFITGVVADLEKLPRVSGGIQNSIENMADAMKDARIPLGQGIADLFGGISKQADGAVGLIKRIGTEVGQVFSAIGRSGVLSEVLDNLGSRLGKIFGSGGGLQAGLIRFAAATLSILKNLPDTIAEIGGFISQLFGTIWSNIKAVAEWGYASLQAIFGMQAPKEGATGYVGQGDVRAYDRQSPQVIRGGLSEVGQGIGMGIDALGYTPGGLLTKFFSWGLGKLTGINSVNGFAGLSGLLSGQGLSGLLPAGSALPEFPMLSSLPDFKKFRSGLTNPLKDMGGIERILNAYIQPFGLPDGLSFGGNPGMQGKGDSVFANWDKMLAGIEKNTAKTADVLESRRVFGGAENARMGATEAELSQFRQGPDPYTRSVSATMQEAVRRVQLQTQQSRVRRSLYGR
jgi:tape measure domain-containing protein